MKKGLATVVGVAALTLTGSFGIAVLGSPAPVQMASCDPAAGGYAGPVPDVKGLSADQVKVAATIWQTAHHVKGKIGSKASTAADDAAVIGIAVARQESQLGAAAGIDQPNGDGDAGVFQQRQKPGWYGTLAQVTDPAYAARTFFLGKTLTAADVKGAPAPAGPTGYHIPGLADVDGWAELSIIDAAHAVQRSAFPQAVADDIPIARTLVKAFKAGNLEDPAANLSDTAACEPIGAMDCPDTGLGVEKGLTPDGLRVLRCVHQQFPQVTSWAGVGDRPANVDDDHQTGRAVDAMIPGYDAAQGQALGKQVAQWVQANAKDLGVTYVIWDAKIWSVQRADEGWRACGSSAASCYHGSDDTAAHRDHVHVSVQGNAGGTDNGGGLAGTSPGRTITPVEKYVISARFGQTGSWARYHTGLDFAAPVGTELRAAADGVVTHAGPGGLAGGWAGTWVSIRHRDGTQTLYAHMATTTVTVGQNVTAGTRIGVVGMTGRSFGPHCHFEVYPKGVQPGDVYKATDPAAWLSSQGAKL